MIVFFEVNKRLRKPKGQSRMDNLWKTRHETKQKTNGKTQYRKIKR